MATLRAPADKIEYFPYSSAPSYRLNLAQRIESHVGGAARDALIIVPGIDTYTHFDELVRRTESVRVELLGQTVGQDWGGGPLVLL
jgi:hypothetical protein